MLFVTAHVDRLTAFAHRAGTFFARFADTTAGLAGFVVMTAILVRTRTSVVKGPRCQVHETNQFGPFRDNHSFSPGNDSPSILAVS